MDSETRTYWTVQSRDVLEILLEEGVYFPEPFALHL